MFIYIYILYIKTNVKDNDWRCEKNDQKKALEK